VGSWETKEKDLMKKSLVGLALLLGLG